MSEYKETDKNTSKKRMHKNVCTLIDDHGQYKIFLPNASTDYIQKKIDTERQPYELPMLKDIQGRLETGDLVLDIGANIGNHTLYLAATTGCKIVAFEPNKNLTDALLVSVDLNGFGDRITVHTLGLGNEKSKGHFSREIPDNLGGQDIVLGKGDIDVIPLDSFKFDQQVKLIKIDVEGMELACLQGAESLLRKDRPLIYVECRFERDFHETANWLDSRDYRYWDTFNATPTHLFRHSAQIDIEHLISRLQFKSTQDAYKSKIQLTETQGRLDKANLKYRQAQEQISNLKEKLAQEVTVHQETKQKYRKVTGDQVPSLKSTIDDLRAEVEKITSEYIEIQKRLINTRSSVTYQVGYQFKNATTSLGNFVGLPFRLWRLYRQAKKQQNKSRQKNTRPNKTAKSQTPIRSLQGERRSFSAPIPIEGADRSNALIIKGANNNIKIACIMDDFTFSSFSPECNLYNLTPNRWKSELESFKPEMLFVESAWEGKDEAWHGKISNNSKELQDIVQWSRDRSVPTVFWNKEDPVHFHSFLNTAKQFDHVFTTDIDCIGRYKAALGHHRVYLLPFACQPTMHNPIELYERKDKFSYAGAYYRRYPERTRDLESFLDALPNFKPVEIYDRNYVKRNPNYQFPDKYAPLIVGNLPFDKIDQAYKGYEYAINLNSMKQSQTMFARRVYELLACNTITVSNFSRGLELLFGDLVISSDAGDEVAKRLQALTADKETTGKLKLAALRKIMQENTYEHRLNYILSKINSASKPKYSLPSIAVLARVTTPEECGRIIEQFEAQTHENRLLILEVPTEFEGENSSHISYLRKAQSEHSFIKDVIDSCTWIASMLPEDYYGPNYLLDIAVATKYSNADLIGKAAYFQAKGDHLEIRQSNVSYRPTQTFLARQAAVKINDEILNLKVTSWIDKVPRRRLKSENGLAIDPYNYCRSIQNTPLVTIKERVNDLPALDIGLSIDHLQELAEGIAPSENSSEGKLFDLLQLAELLGPSKSKNVDLTAKKSALSLTSRLDDGRHEYLYATRDLKPDALTDDREIKCYIETTPGLMVSLVILFLDAQKQRISHVFFPINCNSTAGIPPETEYLRLGLRVLAAGKTKIKSLLLEHRDLAPPLVLGTAQYLLVTNHYPAYHNLYRNGFVHSRVKTYKKHGERVDVFCLQHAKEPLSFAEFEGVGVLTGNPEALKRALSSGRYKSVLVHFLDSQMWTVLEKYVDSLKIVVWIHGAEIQPMHRREFNYNTDPERKKAKILSDQRMRFWRSILKKIPKNLHLVFVSNYLADEAMTDLNIKLPAENVAIIHNPIDPDLFSYEKKPIEQRTQILSIRPFASAVYANDLSVRAIQILSKKVWFDELDFRIIGDGRLFDETLKPIEHFKNVIIERDFLRQEEIAKLHKVYGIFLCPTRMDSQGVSRDEAMSSGLVPITNAVAAIPEFVDNRSGVLAPGEDAQAMADGIADLYENPKKFLAMSAEAARRVRAQRSSEKIVLLEMEQFSVFDHGDSGKHG